MPKNINLSTSNLKFYSEKLIKNFGWIFLAVLLVMLFFEFFEINTSAQIVFNFNQTQPVANQSRAERINFDSYSQIVNRISAAQNFQATQGITNNPFVLSAVPANATTTAPVQVIK